MLKRIRLLLIMPAVILFLAWLCLAAGRVFTNVTVLRGNGLIEAMGPGTSAYTVMEVLEELGTFVFHNAVIFIVIGVVAGALMSMWTDDSSLMALPGTEGGMVASPVTGKAIALEDVNDGVFSERMIGEGFAVEPSEGRLYAPSDCRVLTVFDTQHAIGLLLKNGIELLVHIGIDTVNLRGEPFSIKVNEGDVLQKGELICTFEINKIAEEGYRTEVLVIVANTLSYKSFELLKTGDVNAGDDVLNIA